MEGGGEKEWRGGGGNVREGVGRGRYAMMMGTTMLWYSVVVWRWE